MEMGETKVDGRGWNDKTDCERQEGKILEPHVRSQHWTYKSLLKLCTRATLYIAWLQLLNMFWGFVIIKFLPER